MFRPQSIAFTFLLLFAACQSDKPKTEIPSETQPIEPAKAIAEIYAINRTNFRMRDQPSFENSEKVALLTYGDFVEYMGETRPEPTPVQLGMMTYVEPFYLVRNMGIEREKGWVHGTGLLRVFKGQNPQELNTEVLKNFAAILGKLPSKELKSGQIALENVQIALEKANPTSTDALFILLENFLHRLEMEGNFYSMVEGKLDLNEAEWAQVWDGNFDMQKHTATQELAAAGYRLNTSEGMLFPTIDYQKLRTFFRAKSSPAMQQYLDMMVENDRSRITSDAGIVLPLKELADRAVRWENFVKQYPDFPVASAKTDAEWMRFSFLCGADNTPALEYDKVAVEPEFKKAWEYALKTYPNSILADMVKKRMELIQKAKTVEEAQQYCADLAASIY